MFSLDTLTQAIPAYRVAGRFGVDVLGLLWPVHSERGGEGVRLCAYSDLSRLLDIDALFEQGAPSRIPRAALRDHVLVVNPRGDFLSTDELALSHVRRHDDRWSVQLEITHRENQDGEPAPRSLYVVLLIDAGNRPLRSLELQFSGCWRDFHGTETALAESAAPSQLIEFLD